ncbi:MAG: response regulator transcription factor [Gemmatimonadaceae bacterium]
MIRVLIAGEIRLYREGLSLHLASQEQLEVIGLAETGDETCRMAREHLPDVILVDISMRDSLQVVHELHDAAPAAHVIALTMPEIDDAVIACAEAGVSGFVMRNASLADLVDAIVAAARGETNVSPRMALTLLRRVGVLAADRAAQPAHAGLTARERDIVALIADGLSNKEIGARLNVELATVKNHVHNILDKLQIHRRGEIASRLRRSAVSSPVRLDLGTQRREMSS